MSVAAPKVRKVSSVDEHEEEKGAPKRVWISASERALTVGGAQRVETGLVTLDANTRGGLRVGKRCVIGGAPGAGKTTLLVNLLWNWAQADILTMLLCYDEEAEDILIRVGQIIGLERDALERGDEHARKHLSRELTGVPNFILIDGDDEDITIGEASSRLAQLRRPGQLSVLGVDSIQTAFEPRTADGLSDTDKARVDRVMLRLKRAGKVDKHLVLATCELNRGGYRSQDARERTDDLAAFKESGGVEYGASLAMVLRSVKDADGMVDVTVPKNRMGTKKPFRLALNFTTATFRESEMPTLEHAEVINSPMQQLKERVVETVRKSIQPVSSIGELSRRLGKGKQSIQRAVKELLEDRRMTKTDAGGYAVLSGSEPVLEPPCVRSGSAVLPLKGNREPEPHFENETGIGEQ